MFLSCVKDLYNNWSIFSGDIPFTNRFCLDLDIGMHFEVKASVLHKNGEDKKLGAKKVAEAGGSGLYPVDYIVSCGPGDISACEAFPTPFKVYSFDLETSIQHDTILCSAVVCENMLDGSRTIHEFRGSEESILIGMTDLLRDFDPDIITGYNIDNFDLPRIVERANTLRRASDHMGKAELIGWGRCPVLLDEMKRAEIRFNQEEPRIKHGVLPGALSSMLGGKRAWNYVHNEKHFPLFQPYYSLKMMTNKKWI